MALVLLGTEACHLCDQAQEILLQLAGNIACDLFVEDISESAELVDRYGLRIPVLLHEESGAELGWPFGHEEVLSFLRQIPTTPPTQTE